MKFRSLLRLRHELARHCSTAWIGSLPHYTSDEKSVVRKHTRWRHQQKRSLNACSCNRTNFYISSKLSFFSNIWLWETHNITFCVRLFNSRQSSCPTLHRLYGRQQATSLSNTTKLLFAWFTSTRGVYQYHTQRATTAICCFFRAKESLLNFAKTETCWTLKLSSILGWMGER